MTICRQWSLVNTNEQILSATTLKCRSWGCDHCRPERRKQLMALAASGAPTRFLTLTVNPSYGSNPASRRSALSAAWKAAVKRLRREYGTHNIEYLAVTEATKAGEPHLHILMRSPYIPQAKLSKIMADLIDAPIVYIERIRGARQVVRYVAKYLTKDPHQFGHSKRYFRSARYDTSDYRQTIQATQRSTPWVVWRTDMQRLISLARYLGMTPQIVRQDYVTISLNTDARTPLIFGGLDGNQVHPHTHFPDRRDRKG